jgi:hypothetical protein
LYRTVGIVKVPGDLSFSFDGQAVLRFDRDLECMNFRDLAPGTRFARVAEGCPAPLQVWDDDGAQVAERYFCVANGELRTLRPVTPAMLTLDTLAIRQDCLCYLMERLPYP